MELGLWMLAKNYFHHVQRFHPTHTPGPLIHPPGGNSTGAEVEDITPPPTTPTDAILADTTLTHSLPGILQKTNTSTQDRVSTTGATGVPTVTRVGHEFGIHCQLTTWGEGQ